MNPTISINVKDLATTDLQRLAIEFEGKDIREAVGIAGVEEVKDFYIGLDAERPNKLDGRRTHFNAQAAESALWRDTGDGVLLDVDQPLGLRQRIQGGEIKPTGGRKYLTIAACAEAYGKRAGEFDNLVPMFRRKADGEFGVIALQEATAQPVKATRRKDGTLSRGKVAGGKVMFWLVKSVQQDADPTAAPDENRIRVKVTGAVTRFFSSLKGGVHS